MKELFPMRNESKLEKELECMELRILESVWCLERSVLDQMEILKKLNVEFHNLKNFMEIQKLQNLDRQSLIEVLKTTHR